MKQTALHLLLPGFLILFGLNSHAITLTPSDCNVDVNCWTSTDNSNPHANDIETLVGSSTDLFLLYKAEVGGNDEGGFNTSYNTLFMDTPQDPADALVLYIGGNSIVCPECYLSIKGGNAATPALYVFDLANWNGVKSLTLNDFWPQRGSISNIALWGEKTDISEPKTIALLGSGLIVFGLYFLGIKRRQTP